MHIEQEVNIFNPRAISTAFSSRDTQISAINGKLSVLMTDAEYQAYDDSTGTMHSRLAQAEQDIDSLDLQFSDTQTRFNAIDGRFSNVDTTLASYSASLNGLSADISSVSQNLSDNYSTTAAMNAAIQASVDGLSSTVSRTYATTSSLNQTASNLESSLKSYADGVGTAVSQSVANTYATTTALNTAKDDLEDYADTAMSSAVNTAVDSAVSQARTLADTALDDAKDYTDDSLTLYATTEQLTSSLAQTTSEITASVSASYVAKTQFDSLAIGATNLLRNTRTLKNAYKSAASYCSVDENADGFAVFTTVESSTNRTVYVQPAPYLNFYDNAKGKTLTVSCMVRSDSADLINSSSSTGIRIGFVLVNQNGSSYTYSVKSQNFYTFPISTEWTKFSYTFEWSGSIAEPTSSSFVVSDETLFGIRFNAYGKYSMQFKMFKLEEGEKATSWSPSPLDAEADILAIDTRLTNAELKITDSAITSTVTSSSAWVSLTDRVDSAQTSITNLDTRLDQAESSITQNANEISTRVTNLTNTVNANKSSADDSISSLNTRMTSAESAITQNASEISTRVSTLSNTVNANSSSINGLTTRMDSAESSITQNASQIATRVAKNGVISAINQSSESITINASKLNLTGYITATNLSTAGQTTINGSNITTGTIKDANSNTVLNLSTGELTVKKGSITLGTNSEFKVTTAGKLTAVSATLQNSTITGHFEALDSDFRGETYRTVIIGADLNGYRTNSFNSRIGLNYPASTALSGAVNNVASNRYCMYLYTKEAEGIVFGHYYGGAHMQIADAQITCFKQLRAKGGIINDSDVRLKENITDSYTPNNLLDSIPVRSYDWKDGRGHVSAGFIAQDVQKVMPELVKADNDGILGIDTIGMIPHMWGIMQGMNSRISSLEMKAKEQS